MTDDTWLVAGSSAPGEVRRYYDALAPEYDATLAGWGYTAPRAAAAMLVRQLPTGEPAHGERVVLDAGCGTGLAGAALREAGFAGRLIGVDVSPASLACAERRGIYDELSVADLQQPLRLADATCDGVICVGVLTYVPDVASVWREFCRITHPAGVVVFTQRDDIWLARNCAAAADVLEREGRWKLLHLGAPEPYLPGNADFGDRILARLIAARIR